MRANESLVWPVAWIPVFTLNLIVPFVLATGVIDQHGRIGMDYAIALYGALGLAACAANSALGRALVVGGLIVGCTQVLPILQCAAGFAGLAIWPDVDRTKAELAGFMITIITGGLLLGVALLIGRLVDASPAKTIQLIGRLVDAPLPRRPDSRNRSGLSL